MKKAQKHPEDMTASELSKATAEFDRSFVHESGRPMTPAQRVQERRLRSGRRNGAQGAKTISISLESHLLQKTDSLAKRKGMSRSQIIAEFVVAGLKRQAV